MNRNHTIAIVAGLAVGVFIGYEAGTTLNGYPPYSWIATYFANQIAANS